MTNNFPSVEQLKKAGTYQEVMIRCRYCDIKDACNLREKKEKFEDKGFVTYCPFTPNRPGKKKKRKKK
jgi:hypothetical protein